MRYVTVILQWIAFIFGRDEEEDQKACRVQERQLSLSCYVLISLETILFEII